MPTPTHAPDDATLQSIARRVLWLATHIVHHANLVRPNGDGMKVGGHQSSSASVVTLLTALYFDFLQPGDKVSIKPHASPVFHAIQYLLGNLEASALTTLREFHGLQAYPSRTKDPDPVDFSTGSVGLGSIAPNFAHLAHEYLLSHGFAGAERGRRFVSLMGDAELDEGSVWEAVAEPALQGLDNLLWIVDLNRQSLDRVIPGIRVRCWREMFAANGWHVHDVKYGRQLHQAFALPNGEILRTCLDELSNPAYQRLLRAPGPVLREWLPAKSRFPRDLERFLQRWSDDELQTLFGNLGGHDFGALRSALAEVATKPGPHVLFAYTLKGWGLPSVGHPQNHSVLLNAAEMQSLRQQLGIPAGEEWARFPAGSPEGERCAHLGARLRAAATSAADCAGASRLVAPRSVGCVHSGRRSTQQAFGNILTALSRECPDLARRMVTMSPDVASSTNLGGWINKYGVWERHVSSETLPPEPGGAALKWRDTPSGQHVELGISENNLFMALGQFGLTQELFGELLLPVGTLYDPFIRRGLDAFFYGTYSGARFIVVGTPSGLTLAAEGGAHQSLGSQSIGTEMPDLDAYEPCFGAELEWILLHALGQLSQRGRSSYLRLSTRPVDQALFPMPTDATATEQLRQDVLRGAYRLPSVAASGRDNEDRKVVNLFATGAVLPEAIEAAALLAAEGIGLNVINVTGPGPLYRDFQRCRVEAPEAGGEESHLERLVPAAERARPVVTLADDHPHSLAWIGGALGATVHPLGVSRFGQSGSRVDLYRDYGLDAAAVVAACRRALNLKPATASV
jgi:pyruvate dehydrogenase E1 component